MLMRCLNNNCLWLLNSWIGLLLRWITLLLYLRIAVSWKWLLNLSRKRLLYISRHRLLTIWLLTISRYWLSWHWLLHISRHWLLYISWHWLLHISRHWLLSWHLLLRLAVSGIRWLHAFKNFYSKIIKNYFKLLFQYIFSIIILY